MCARYNPNPNPSDVPDLGVRGETDGGSDGAVLVVFHRGHPRGLFFDGGVVVEEAHTA